MTEYGIELHKKITLAKLAIFQRLAQHFVSFWSVLAYYQGQQVKEEAGVFADQIIRLRA